MPQRGDSIPSEDLCRARQSHYQSVSVPVSSELNRTLPVLMLLPPGAAIPQFLGNLSVN
jgi:hypothetical protein